MTAVLPLVLPLTTPLAHRGVEPALSGQGGGVRPPTGYAFIIQNNKIVMLAGKPVLRKVS